MNKDILLSQRNNGISWFYWITGLSLINTLVNYSDWSYSFIVGLWYTQLIDSIALGSRDSGSLIMATALFFASLLVSGFFALSGHMTEFDKRWWYLTAMILYFIDIFIYFYLQDFVGIGFHIFALVYIYKWYIAHTELLKMSHKKSKNHTAK
jgi:hypothetical protein